MKMASSTGRDTSETPSGASVTFSPFGKLKIEIADTIEEADVIKFATLIDLKPAIKGDILSKLLPSIAFLDELEKQDLIRPDNVDYLIRGFREISHEQLARRVERYKYTYASNSTGGRSFQRSSSRAESDCYSPLLSSEDGLPIDAVTFGVDLFPELLDQKCSREPIIVCQVEDDKPLVVLTARIQKAGTSKEKCAQQLEFLKQKIWRDSLENLDHLSEVVSLLRILYGAILVKITNDELQLHFCISNEKNLRKLQTEVWSGELAAALGERFLSIMDIGEEEASSLKFTVSIDEESVKHVRDSSTAEHAEKQNWQEHQFFCDYCKVILDEKWQHDHHIETDAHKGKLAMEPSSPDRKDREPSLSITNGRFQYCPQFSSSGICSDNCDCTFAHSTREITEWEDRHNHRMEVIESYNKQPPTSEEYSGQKQRSKWDELITKYNQEKEKKGSVTTVGKVSFLEDYDSEFIAKGSNDVLIFLGEYDDVNVAVKQLPRQSLQKEKELHEKMKDIELSNVLKMLCIESDRRSHYIVTPICEEDLSCLIEGPEGASRLSQTQQINLCLDILKGLKNLHNLDILHRDLKPRNVLIGQSGEAFLADFGISRDLGKQTTLLTSIIGTQCWLPTECLDVAETQTPYKKAADIQVAAFLLYYILSMGHHPFEATSPFIKKARELTMNQKEGRVNLSHLGDHFPEDCAKLLTEMLDKNPYGRPKIEHCVERMEAIKKMIISQPVYLCNEDITMEMPDVIIEHGKLSVDLTKTRNFGYTWKFSVKSKMHQLKRVYFYHSKHDHFYFAFPKVRNQSRPKELKGVKLKPDAKGFVNLSIKFQRKGGQHLYHQWVIFDFGVKPCLCKQLLVWISPESINTAHFEADSWDNYDVIKYDPNSQESEFPKLLKRYPFQESSHSSQKVECLTDSNFKEYFEGMIVEEEKACRQKIKRFNGKCKMEVMKQVDRPGHGLLVASPGRMYGKISMTTTFDDSDATQLVRKWVRMVWLSFKKDSEIVYEAEVVAYRYWDLREFDNFYVSLSEQCVKDQHLNDGWKSDTVEVMFKIDRLSFCKQRFAIDSLEERHLLFPPSHMFPRFIEQTGNQTHQQIQKERGQGECDLNHRQAEAKDFLVRAKDIVPFRQGPSLLIGPFGTGKTLTLSLTIKEILESDSDSKLLVCTHSNSAADLFLTKYLKQFCEEFQGGILRLYAPNREASTVPEEIRERRGLFCICDPGGHFAKATIDHVKRYRIIITTLSTSIYLVELKKAKGLFTHIFIDEAGQALETEAMMPLALAGPRTVVVLSGDHKQLRPVVVSEMARKHHFFPSMLERLFDWSKNNGCNNSHFLTDNYRMRQEILDFIGEHCYKIKNFKAVKVEHQQENLDPVLFSAVDGKEAPRGLSYINEAEANEIVNGILQLKSSWPEKELGEFRAKDQVAVFASYVPQVKLLRKRLRSKDLSHVVVDTVHNVQGNQFRVVFISSVRTRLANADTTQRRDDDYLGILSDEGELITAFTRARSRLHVFGDPVALCMLGRCKSIWRKYIELCQEKKTLHGSDSVLSEISSFCAVEHPEQAAITASVSSDTSYIPEEDLSADEDSYDTDVEYESAESALDDEILKELDKQNREERSREDSESIAEEGEPVVEEREPTPIEDTSKGKKTKTRKKGKGKIKYRMLQDDEKVFLERIKMGDEKTSRLEGGEIAETEEEEEEKMDDEERIKLYTQKARENPDEYRICLVRFVKDNAVHGIPCGRLDADKPTIILSNKRNRKQALDGDQVVVKIKTKKDVTYGEVMCIKRRSTELKWRKLVCTLDPDNIGLMCPIAYSSLYLYPKMFIFPRKVKKTLDGIKFFQYTINPKSPDEKVQQEKEVFVRYSDMKNRLFVVQYYKWFSTEHPYPMGIVTEELSPCDSLPAGLKILRLRHGVKEKWPRHLLAPDLMQFSPTWKIPDGELHRRAVHDYRRKQVLTIGSPDQQNSDYAFHIERSSEAEVQLGIHIPDVAYFVSKDTPLDREALKRGNTFYNDLPNAMNTASHMLPDVLSTNLCIFKPGEDRLSVSIILSIDKSSGTVNRSDIARSVICCQQNLNYKHVEDFLSNNYDGNFEFWKHAMGTLEMLHKLSTSLSSCPPMKVLACKDFINYPGAVTLFHKLVALANTALATKLRDMTGPKLVYHQGPPQQEELQGCDQTFINDSHKLLNPSSTVSQQVGLSEESEDDAVKDEFVSMLKGTYEKIKKILHGGKDKIFQLGEILLCMDRYPQQIASMAQLRAITPTEELACTENLPASADEYNFLSPLTSFAGLVTQRLLIACIEGTENPYLNEDVSHIAHLCFRQMQNAKSYAQSVELLVFALKLRIVPHSLPAVVQCASDEKLEVTYPSAEFLDASFSATSVAQCHLKPGKRPELVQEKEKSIQIQWRNRIYDCQTEEMELRSHNTTLWLSTHEHIQHIPRNVWQQMITIVHEKRYSELHDLERKWETAQRQLSRKDLHEENAEVISEVTCERPKTKKKSSELKKYVEFNRQFNPGDVVEVHLTTKLQDGIPMPTIQLFKLTPKYGICLEHRALPVECFTEVADKSPTRCSTIEEYIRLWSPLLKMLIAYNTIMNDETIVIHGVSIKWLKKEVVICGTFTLQKQWCDDRQIIFSYLSKKKKSAEVELPDPTKTSLLNDYVCIRLHGYDVGDAVRSRLQELGSKDPSATLETGIALPSKGTILVHGIAGITNVERPSETENYEVEFQVSHTSCPLPDDLFDHEKSVTCTVELIPKSEPEKRMEAALAGIINGGEIVNKIVLCEDIIPEDIDDELKEMLQDGSRVGSEAFQRFFKDVTPNKYQKEAIQKALSQPFTVIQGPPGTGKTRTGAYLTTLLAQLNRRRGKQQQILYCGPSNKSVDVIAMYLQSFQTKELKFVRVYSDFIEQLDFPIPGVESAERKFSHTIEEMQKTDIQKDSLHHIIRSPQKCTLAKEVNQMYDSLQKGKLQPTLPNIRRYKEIVRKAKIEVLKGMEVILCTCNAAGHFILKENLNILQCVIDEAGMCFELDTLVPLVCHQPKQVVLIGDHKQLRPIIQEPRVKQLKADISLMEKYQDKAYTLSIQYRMHKDICEFPSKEFYNDTLITDRLVLRRRPGLPTKVWPGPDHRPRVFCHIEGEEDSQTVKTAEGNENSRRNIVEAKEVVKLAISLLGNQKVEMKKLVILSQYKLQCNLIHRMLQKTPHKNVKVQTIIKSQGSEWDYVILSTVRSLPEEEIPETPGKSWRRINLGFIEDENQMNVGITRAMQGLIIVGNKNLLSTCRKWRELLDYYDSTGSVIPSNEFLQRTNRRT